MAFQIFFKHFKFFFVTLAAWLCMADQALAVRVARFSAIGQNMIKTDQIKSQIGGSCSITLTNPSSTPQVVTITINLYATVASGPGSNTCDAVYRDYAGLLGNGLVRTISKSITLAAHSTGMTGADCSSGSNTCTLPTTGDDMDFPQICPGDIVTQDVRCEGEIKVENSVAGVPGHITASGTLTTVVESLGGVTLSTHTWMGGINKGNSGTNTAAPTFTPIMIGEGKPF